MRGHTIGLALLVARAAHAAPPDLGASGHIELFPPSILHEESERRAPPTPVERMQADTFEAAGVARVQSGQVPPAWRAAERAIKGAFHPAIDVVAIGPAPRALVEQVLSNPAEGPARTRAEPTPSATGEVDLTEQVEAAHLASRRPLHWRAVEIEVRVNADGGLESARLLTHSDSARLDEAALAVVRQEIDRRRIVPVGGMRVARFRVAAARSVVPLDVSPVLGTEAKVQRVRGIVPRMRFHFDETNGNVTAEKPFSQELHTEVKLLSVTPAR